MTEIGGLSYEEHILLVTESRTTSCLLRLSKTCSLYPVILNEFGFQSDGVRQVQEKMHNDEWPPISRRPKTESVDALIPFESHTPWSITTDVQRLRWCPRLPTAIPLCQISSPSSHGRTMLGRQLAQQECHGELLEGGQRERETRDTMMTDGETGQGQLR